MSTNFYLQRNLKLQIHAAIDEGDYAKAKQLMDDENLHIGHIAAGWLPLFETHDGIRSVQDYKTLYETEHCIIEDEYGRTYTWEQFTQRVLQWNGGVHGAIPLTPYDQNDIDVRFRDYDMPNHVPVSHFEYAHSKYADRYFTDPEGYEFTEGDFR